MICLLLDEAARSFDLDSSRLPWSADEVSLCVSCQPPQSVDSCSLIAPRAYLAGLAFKKSLQKQTAANIYAESLQSLNTEKHLASAIAMLKDTQQLNRKDRDANLILLRQVWPTRRFDLPREAPVWLWDALYLVGLISDELSLTLPQGWHRAPGILTLWAILTERYRLTEIFISETGVQSLHFIRTTDKVTSVHVHRNSQKVEIPCEIMAQQKPGTTQVWLKASEPVVALLCNKALTVGGNHWSGLPASQAWGAFVFLQTNLGKHLWALCSDQSALPEFDTVTEAILTFGVPIPNEIILSDLSLVGSADTLTVPEDELLEREFASIFGPTPNLPESSVHIIPDKQKIRRKSNAQVDQIASKIFLDGIPHFPEHYLMHIYRPVLTHYDLRGPVEIAEEFFERISLRTISQVHTLEVSGKIVAEA
ncbi:MAG: hypothetical protein KAI15_08170, partial [Gammaproteobacteria bacterium]|nr:hypothetical protein [Gammaproteobacteria bacterium]